MNSTTLRATIILLIVVLLCAGSVAAQAVTPTALTPVASAHPGHPLPGRGRPLVFRSDYGRIVGPDHGELLGPMALSPDGGVLAYWRLLAASSAEAVSAELWIVDLATTTATRVALAGGTVGHPAGPPTAAVSPGWPMAVSGSQSPAKRLCVCPVWPWPASRPRHRLECVRRRRHRPGRVRRPIRPVGLASGWQRARLVLALASGDEPRSARAASGALYVAAGGALWQADPAGTAPARALDVTGFPADVAVTDLAASPDGAFLAIATATGFGLLDLAGNTYAALDIPAGPGLRLHWADAGSLFCCRRPPRPPPRRPSTWWSSLRRTAGTLPAALLSPVSAKQAAPRRRPAPPSWPPTATTTGIATREPPIAAPWPATTAAPPAWHMSIQFAHNNEWVAISDIRNYIGGSTWT